jgi:hypothetical protein
MSKYIYCEIDSPVNRVVYQRDLNNEAVIPLSGRIWGDGDITSVHARLVPVNASCGTPVPTMDIPFDPLAGTFSAKITAKAGWYRLEVNAFSEGGELGTAADSIDHVGVGEVFITFGHSCAQGGLKEDPGAQDDRACCVNHRHSLLHECNLTFEFSHMGYGKKLGPWNASTHGWAALADQLIERLHVPVLIYGAAFGGTNIEMNYNVTQNIPYEHAFSKYHRGMPYRPLAAALRHYAVRTGVRAVLTQHGGNDVATPTTRAQFAMMFRTVIEHTRTAHGLPNLGFMLMKEGEFRGEWSGPGEEKINGGIADVLATVPQTFRGPYYGDIPGGEPYRPDYVHLSAAGVPLYAALWAKAILDSDFLSKCVPSMPIRL